MIDDRTEIGKESARLGAETRRLIDLSRAERAKTDRLIYGGSHQGPATRSHRTQPHSAKLAQSSIWKRVSLTWLASYEIASENTDPPSWVLGWTDSEVGQFVPIVVFDSLKEAEELFDRLMEARANKARLRLDR
jgi:hypothetical protein